MKTILHVIPSLSGGGAERQMALLAAEQARRGWNVHIACRRRGPYEKHLAGTPVTWHDLGDYRRGHPVLFWRLDAIVRHIRPKILQTWLLQMDIIGGVIALARSVPWVLTERSSREAEQVTPISSRLRRALGGRADVVVANSTAGTTYWSDYIDDSAKIVCIQNAVDVDMIRGAPAVQCALGAQRTILAVGRLVPVKAHAVVIEAIARIDPKHDVQLLVIGDGPLRSELTELIAQRGLRERVTILPFDENWWGRLKTATALVNASRFEGQPNVVLEAMAAECPLILSDISQHREIIDEHATLFVPPNAADALARAIERVITDPLTARERAKAALARLGRASISHVADAYESVYRSIE